MRFILTLHDSGLPYYFPYVFQKHYIQPGLLVPSGDQGINEQSRAVLKKKKITIDVPGLRHF